MNDSGMTWGATLLFPQSLQWQIELNKAATSMNYGILLQGFGGIFAVPLIEAYGRSVSSLLQTDPTLICFPASQSGSGRRLSQWVW